MQAGSRQAGRQEGRKKERKKERKEMLLMIFKKTGLASMPSHSRGGEAFQRLLRSQQRPASMRETEGKRSKEGWEERERVETEKAAGECNC